MINSGWPPAFARTVQVSCTRTRTADWTEEDTAILQARWDRLRGAMWANLFIDYRDADSMLALTRLRGVAPMAKPVALRLLRAATG